jgi:IclR family transcriptional regulator, KDG regulon repressor
MGTTSLARGLKLLECYDEKHESFNAQAFADRLELPISTVYRYLDILSEHKFLHKNPLSKKYHLGISIHRLGRLLGDESALVRVAQPFMEKLAQDSTETVFLTVLANGESVCIKTIESRQRIRLSIEEGTHQPLHAGASSRILLAYQTEAFIKKWIAANRLPRITEATICDEAEMLRVLKTTNKEGYTVSDSEVDEGSLAIAAPILDSNGKLVAGLSVAGPKTRLTSALIPNLIKAVVQTARDIGEELRRL